MKNLAATVYVHRLNEVPDENIRAHRYKTHCAVQIEQGRSFLSLTGDSWQELYDGLNKLAAAVAKTHAAEWTESVESDSAGVAS